MDKSYSQYSVGQAKANQAAQQLLMAAVKDISSGSSTSTGPFCVADIGSSVGNNSIVELATVVRCLNEQGAEDKEVSITHVDQLSNQWDQLMHSLASIPGGYPKARTPGQGGPIFSYALARDMYQPCFPAASVDLVYSGITFHWGSTAINPVDHIVAQFSADEQTLRAGEKQGRSDLLQWLRMRAKELKPGGHLIATAIGSSDDASFMATRRILDIAKTCWDRIHSRGGITQEEHSSTCFPLYFFNLEACLDLVNKELSNQFEVLHHMAGGAMSEAGSQSSAASREQACGLASEGMMAVLGPVFRKFISDRPRAEQDDIMQSLKQAMKQEYLATNFIPSTRYILLALRRK